MPFWPKTLDFASAVPFYGQNYLLYLGVVPQLADTSWGVGRIHKGYGAGLAAAATKSFATDPAKTTIGFMHRGIFATDVRVALSSYKTNLDGAAPNELHLDPGHAVAARIQAGILAEDGTHFVRYRDVTGYVLVLQRQGSGALKLRLIRYISGTPAEVDASTEFDGPTGGFYTPFLLELTLTNNLGNVDYVGKVSGLMPTEGKALPSTPPVIHGTQVAQAPYAFAFPKPEPIDSVVITGTDAHIDKILTSGRAGFFLDRERIEPDGVTGTARVLSIADEFEIEDDPLGTPTILWADDFVRAVPAAAESLTDGFGTAGNVLQSELGGDQHALDQDSLLARNVAGTVEVAETEDMGEAANLPGTGTQRLVLQNPTTCYPSPPALAANAEWTVFLWARLDTNRDGNGFVDHYDTTAEDGFAYGLVTAPPISGDAAAKFEITLGNGTAPTVYESAAFVVDSVHLGSPWCYVVSYKANANPGTGEGRLRCYACRMGHAKLISEIVVASTVRPTWPPDFQTILGERKDKTGIASNHALDGVVDEYVVSFFEMSAKGIEEVVNPYDGTPSDWFGNPDTPIRTVWTMDSWSGTPEATLATHGIGTGVSSIEVENGAASIAPGLVPVRPITPLNAFFQRPVESLVEMRSSCKFKLGNDLSRGRVFVRGAPGGLGGGSGQAEHYQAYCIDVAAGSPAFLQIVRRTLVTFPVLTSFETILARQNLSTGAIDIAKGAFHKLDIEVTQAGLGPTANPTIAVQIDDTPVTWEAVDAAALLDLDGNVIDSSTSLKIPGGNCSGFSVVTVGATDTEIDDFVIETPSLAQPDADTFPPYPVPAEDDGKTGDLASVLVPGWGLERMTNLPRIEIRTYVEGVPVLMLISTFARRYYEARLVGATDAEVAGLVAFFDSHDGTEIAFDFDPSPYVAGDRPGVFHFLEDRLVVGYQGGARVFSFHLEERVSS